MPFRLLPVVFHAVVSGRRRAAVVSVEKLRCGVVYLHDIAAAGREIGAGSALLDGEIVAVDESGNTGFSALQQAIGAGGRGLTLFLFDALEIDGEDLAPLPNIERKQRLASLLGEGKPPFLLYADHIVGAGEKLLDAMCEAGQEGIIAKRKGSAYVSRRSPDFTELTIDLEVYDLKHLSAIIAQLRAKAVVAKVERVNG